MFELKVVFREPVVVSTTSISAPPSSLRLNASAKLAGTTISFSPVAPLKFILSVKYKSFHALVALPISKLSVASGIRLLLISALILILSVSSSPKLIVPPIVMLH